MKDVVILTGAWLGGTLIGVVLAVGLITIFESARRMCGA